MSCSVNKHSDCFIEWYHPAKQPHKEQPPAGKPVPIGEYGFEQMEVCARLGTRFKERLAQVALSIGRISGAQFITETRNFAGIKRRVV